MLTLVVRIHVSATRHTEMRRDTISSPRKPIHIRNPNTSLRSKRERTLAAPRPSNDNPSK